MRGTIVTVHFIDFHTDARHAICGWSPPADYAGTTVFMSSATCPACIEAIQRRIGAIHRDLKPHNVLAAR